MNNNKKEELNYHNLNEVIGLSKKMLKILYTCVILAIIVFIIILFKNLEIFKVLGSILGVISPFFIGLVIAWLLDPAVTYLQKKNVKRSIGTIVVFFVFILILYLYGFKEALLINVVRIILMGLLFTNVSMILYSLAGGLLSLACMGLAKKAHGFSIQCVSMIGGITHNLGQILVAFAVVRTYGVFYYVPFLLLAGSVTGWVIGMLEKTIEPRLRHYLQTEK